MSSVETTPEENYSQGIQCFRDNNFNKGIQYLTTAAKAKYTPAIKELGVCYLYGIAVKQNIDKAINYFKYSKQEPESQYELAKFYFFGFGVKKDLDLARKLLILAVKNKHSQAINLMAVCSAISKDYNRSNALFNLSLETGDRFAKHLQQMNLISEAQEIKIADFQWPTIKPLSNKKIINSQPDIFAIDDFLSAIECEYIKFISSPFMRESMIVDPKTGQFIKDKIRTSFSASLDWISEDPAINLIIHKCCVTFNEKQEQSETMHVLHYSIGEEYKPHYDFFGGMNDVSNFETKQQRIKTVIVYLNDVLKGGGTSFPRLEKTIEPQKGKAVFFENFNRETTQPYIDSLHAGNPVIEGEKWLASLWLRDKSTGRGPKYESI